MKAGSVVVGVSGVRAALRRGELALVVVAGDHSERTTGKVLALARGRGVPVLAATGAVALGSRLGRGPLQAVGVRDRRLASGILRGS